MIFVNKTWQSIIMKSIITVFFQSLPIIEYFKVTALTTPKCKYFLFTKKIHFRNPEIWYTTFLVSIRLTQVILMILLI